MNHNDIFLFYFKYGSGRWKEKSTYYYFTVRPLKNTLIILLVHNLAIKN
jgi:hypothetical protein